MGSNYDRTYSASNASNPAAAVGDIQAAINAGVLTAAPKTIDIDSETTGVFVREGVTLVQVPKRKLPDHVSASPKFDDAESFVEYFLKFRTPHSQIFANLTEATFKAVFDYHAAVEAESVDQVTSRRLNVADWCHHTASYACPRTKEWQIWSTKDRKTMDQVEFAQFLEDNLPDIVEPAGADLLVVARTLEAKKSVNFSSAVKLENGQTQLLYEEEIKGTAAKGTMDIPAGFVLGVKPFEGSDGYRISARLRYRLNQGEMVFWYELVRPHKIIEDAVTEAVKKIETGTGMRVFRGSL